MHEVAAFVDLENIRYSMLNRWHQEPDPLAWRDKARKYGLIGIARAYADFEQHPPQLRQRLNVAGFEAEHYELSMSIGELRLFSAIRAEPEDAIIAATGVSCRQQIAHGTGRPARHQLEILRQAMAGGRGVR